MILVVDRESGAASRLKSMIEFFDSPRVVTAAPEDWRRRLEIDQHGRQRLDAVFLGTKLKESEIDEVVGGVGRIDPNVSIVLLAEDKQP
ncbi:MAG: hypothetical protein AAFX56_01955 [Pseudomonadota bacterium]